MISGAHVILTSTDAEKDRAFLRSVLDLPWVDAGDGWLIFALPPAEVAVHPAESGGAAELYLLTTDLAAARARLKARKVPVSDPEERAWGRLVTITLPSGATLGLYEPRHPLAPHRAKSRAPTTGPARRSRPAP